MFNILKQRFGIERAAFHGLQLLKKSRREIYAVTADHQPPQLVKCITGLPLFHVHFKYPKPTTSCATAFGCEADRNRIDLYPDQLQAYLSRKPFDLTKTRLGPVIAAATCSYAIKMLLWESGFMIKIGELSPVWFPKAG